MSRPLSYPGSPEKTRDYLWVTVFRNSKVAGLLTTDPRLPKLVTKPWIRSDLVELILQNVQVIDPQKSSLLDGLQDVQIQHGLIASVNPHGSKFISADAVVVDLNGRFLCP